jgi:hypothetical protein
VRLPSAPVRILVVAVLLTLALVGVVVREGVARAGGEEVRLAITGYDPRNLLSGHYVLFQLADRLPVEQVCPDPEHFGPVEAWFGVAPAGEAHRIVAAGVRPEATQLRGTVLVRGRVTCSRSPAVPPGGMAPEPDLSAPLDIGVDRIHLDQGQAEALEKRLRDRDNVSAHAVFSIDGAGKARLKGLIVEGRRYDLDWW